jgi:hypothetical protein
MLMRKTIRAYLEKLNLIAPQTMRGGAKTPTFDVLAEIERRLENLTEIMEPKRAVDPGDKFVGKITFDRTKGLYTLTIEVEKDCQVATESVKKLFDYLAEDKKEIPMNNPDYNEARMVGQNLSLLLRGIESMFAIQVRAEIRNHLYTSLNVCRGWDVVHPRVKLRAVED